MDLNQALADAFANFKYGKTDQQLSDAAANGSLPGAPPLTQKTLQSGIADRYAGAYNGAQKWGSIPAQLVNNLALEDIGPAMGFGNAQDSANALQRKQQGDAAIDAATGPHNKATNLILDLLRGYFTGGAPPR